MPVPQGEDVAAVLALAPPELRACEPVVALERLIADRDEELAFLRERCVQFEVRARACFHGPNGCHKDSMRGQICDTLVRSFGSLRRSAKSYV